MKNNYEKYKENLGTIWEIDGVEFYEYPENPVYWISKCGVVYNADKKFILKATIIQSGKSYYTVTINKKRTRLHRMLAITFLNNPFDYPVVDHLNSDTLNNNLENLRWASISMNTRNTKKKPNTKNKHKGVRLTKSGKFEATIRVNYKKKILGYFATEALAAEAYNTIASQLGLIHLNKINND